MREFFVNRPDTAAMERLLGSHASDAAGVAVRLAWQAGLLRDEITNLTWDQVDFERNQLQLPARTIPITQMLADYLRSVYRKWTFLTGNSTNNCVICSDRYHKQMQPQAISRIARRVLDEVGQTNVRLVDLRHDYIIRQLEQHDWSYVARITGMEIRSLQLHFAQYLPNGRAGPKHSEKSGDIDEFKLWKILQAEKDTPAGLVLWLTWSMGLTAKNIVSLTWDQVDLEKNLIHLPEGEVPLTAAAKRILAKRLQKRTEDLHVLLSAESKKPMDVSRVSRITRTALIRGGMENWTLRDLWTRYEKSNWEQKITEAIRRSGPITRSQIMELYGQTNICQVIASAMKPAKEKKIIATDPTEGCALPKLEHREMKTLPVEQLTSFLQEAKESGVFEMYYAELAARLRKGELLGLKWEEIDLDRGGLWVKRHGARINGEVAASLKTKNANQTLPPAEDTIQVLKQQRKKTSAVPGCFPHPPAVYLTGQRPAYTPPGAETGGSASGQVPRFTAYIRTAGPPERGRYQDDIRDAGALQRGVHPAYLCPRHHSGPEGGG